MAWSVLWQHHVFAVLRKKTQKKTKTQQKKKYNRKKHAHMGSDQYGFVFWFNTSSLSGLGGNEKRGYCCGQTAVLRTNFMQISDEGPLNLIKMPWNCEAVAETNATSPLWGKPL